MLDPPPGSSVIDACAAPGNKTTHLSAIMRDKGYDHIDTYITHIIFSQIYAFDHDAKRLEVLKSMVHKSGATCVKVQLADFLKVIEKVISTRFLVKFRSTHLTTKMWNTSYWIHLVLGLASLIVVITLLHTQTRLVLENI